MNAENSNATFNVRLEGLERIAQMLTEISSAVERYIADVSQPEEPGLKVGDHVLLTGTQWEGNPYVDGNVVVIEGVDREGAFFRDREDDQWYVYTPDREEYESWGGKVVDPEIRVGDTVRIKPEYEEAVSKFSNVDENKVGTEFVVTKVNEGSNSVNGSKFYVDGDPNGWGMWEIYIEKVYS